MKASGPFAMGPSLAGSGRRPVPRSNFTPIMPSGPTKDTRLGSGLTQTTAPTLGVKGGTKPGEDVKTESDEEAYSEPDEGVEIVDISDVRKMDWMAPETLKRESEYKGKVKPKRKDKKPLARLDNQGEGLLNKAISSASLTSAFKDMDVDEPVVDDIDLANAVNLSESEDEIEEEQIAGDFFTSPDPDFVCVHRSTSSGSLTCFPYSRTLTHDRIKYTSFNSLQNFPRLPRCRL